MLKAALYLRPGPGAAEKTAHLLRREHTRQLAWVVYAGQMAGELGAVQRGREEEAQRRRRAVERRRQHATLGQMHLVAAHVVGRCRVGRAAEEGCESLDVPDIIVARLVAELAHGHVFEHAAAQIADGLLAHRKGSCLEVEVPNPSILKTERPPRHLSWGSTPLALT